MVRAIPEKDAERMAVKLNVLCSWGKCVGEINCQRKKNERLEERNDLRLEKPSI